MELHILLVALLTLWIQITNSEPDNTNADVRKHPKMLPVIVKSLQETQAIQEEIIDGLTKQLQDQCLMIDQMLYTSTLNELFVDPIPLEEGFLQIVAAAQSSTYQNNWDVSGAHKAVDGDRNVVWGWGNGCTATENGGAQWWQGELKHHSIVTQVTLTNRDDVPERLSYFEILGFEEDPIQYPDQSPQVCTFYNGMIGLAVTETVQCDTAIEARYLRLAKESQEILTICEFQPEGRTSFDVATLSRATQSSSSLADPGTRAWRAVDRDRNTCTLTDVNQRHDHWWQLNFQQLETVVNVTITNRDDANYHWLKEIVITVHESDCVKEAAGQSVCASYVGTIGQGEKMTLKCDPPVQGRVLRITKKRYAGEALSLCDVRIATQGWLTYTQNECLSALSCLY